MTNCSLVSKMTFLSSNLMSNQGFQNFETNIPLENQEFICFPDHHHLDLPLTQDVSHNQNCYMFNKGSRGSRHPYYTPSFATGILGGGWIRIIIFANEENKALAIFEKKVRVGCFIAGQPLLELGRLACTTRHHQPETMTSHVPNCSFKSATQTSGPSGCMTKAPLSPKFATSNSPLSQCKEARHAVVLP